MEEQAIHPDEVFTAQLRLGSEQQTAFLLSKLKHLHRFKRIRTIKMRHVLHTVSITVFYAEACTLSFKF